MCLACIDYAKGNMTGQEAMRALGEILTTAESGSEAEGHAMVAIGEIADKEIELMHASGDEQ